MPEEKDNDEPIIEVTATPMGGSPLIEQFPYSSTGMDISLKMVPEWARKGLKLSEPDVADFIDALKENYTLVINRIVTEEKDRGWWSHMDCELSGKVASEGGEIKAAVKGTPKHEKTKREERVEISLRKCKEQDC
ncbi:MAG TPA: hypothetical protein VMW89_16275 [Desulfatiglandales bacterium]|nr:hypothetical protein [Desulfatiglandales bacterium]